MDIAQTRFETPHKIITLLDAPGHKDFIPNMITGMPGPDCSNLTISLVNALLKFQMLISNICHFYTPV